MSRKSVLFLSWAGGMGHITRDLAIAGELRRQNPEIELFWMAHPLASKLIEQAGEKLLPESQLSSDYNQAAIPAVSGFSFNLMKYVKITQKVRQRNVDLFKKVIARHHFDLVIGDESYEILNALFTHQIVMQSRMVLIEDYVGVSAMTANPLERLGVYQRNRAWALARPRFTSSEISYFFIGELEDVPDTPFGFFLPNRREFAKKYYHFLGYVIRFDPSKYADRASIRARLGYGVEPLLICATGGTAAGKELLEKCGKAYTIARKRIPGLRMIAVCGELLGTKPPDLPTGVELVSFIPNLYEHYAACDMAVVVGGGTTTIELTALRRPFIFFPLENQFDQQLYVAGRLARHGAGIKMGYRETAPEALAETISANIGKDVNWKPIPVDGAQTAARLVSSYLTGTI